MMEILERLDEFADEHPVWMWIFTRLVICVCGSVAALAVLIGLFLLCVPFVLISDYSAGIAAFAWWLLLPVVALIAWAMVTAISFVYERWVE